MSKTTLAVLLLVPAVLGLSTPAAAQAATPREALAQCVSLKTTGADRLDLVRWIVGALGSGKAVAGIVTVDAQRKDASDRAFAALMTRLLTVDCRAETLAVFKAGDKEAVGAAFRALGEIAVEEATRDQATNAALESFTRFVDKSAFEQLGR